LVGHANLIVYNLGDCVIGVRNSLLANIKKPLADSHDVTKEATTTLGRSLTQ
jgi:hypothetical protein